MIPIKLIRSHRRTISLEITSKAFLVVRAPYRVSENYVEKLVQEKMSWIQKKIMVVKNRPKPLIEKSFDAQTLILYKQKAKKIISERAVLYAKQMGVNFASVKINNARKRWGSCSHKNHLNFGWKLILQPLEIVDYVVIHELAHIIHKNHSQEFWRLVAVFCPEFKMLRKKLKNNQISHL